MRKQCQAGVTLVEVLIAVTLLSLLTLGMLFAMRIGLSSLAKTDDKLMTNRRVAGAQRVLESELEGLMPVKLNACGGTVFSGNSGPVLFQADEQVMRLVSTFSLQQAWRGQPQLLELFIIPGEERGVRLVVNEIPYSPMTAGKSCQAFAPDQATGLMAPRFAPPQTSNHSFVLADRLAYCRFSYLVKSNRPDQPVPKWTNAAPGSTWPLAIRVEMAPFQPDPSLLQPITVTAPIYLHRSPQIEYGDY
jgi:prepilin-type N-terminal cleavage/methylation domain-containing protein